MITLPGSSSPVYANPSVQTARCTQLFSEESPSLSCAGLSLSRSNWNVHQMRMKENALSLLGLVFMAATLFILPTSLGAQVSPPPELRYRIFDVGTFGGPNSQTNGTTRIMNNAGVVAGMADTDQLCPHAPVFKSPAFRWRDGVLTNLGLLPGGCGSLPNAINDRGTIVGSSDNDIFDPQTGLFEIHPDMRKNGRIRDLGTFGGHHGLSSGVNNNDIVVGGAENKEPDPFDFGGVVIVGLPSTTAWQAFGWSKGKLHTWERSAVRIPSRFSLTTLTRSMEFPLPVTFQTLVRESQPSSPSFGKRGACAASGR